MKQSRRSIEQDTAEQDTVEAPEAPTADDAHGSAELETTEQDLAVLGDAPADPAAVPSFDDAESNASGDDEPSEDDERASETSADVEPEESGESTDAVTISDPEPQPRMRRLRRSRSRKDETASAEDTDESRRAVQESYERWASARERSYAWRLMEAMRENQREARAAVRRYQRDVERIFIPAPGELIRLRKNFHSSFITWWLVLLAVATTVTVVGIALKDAASEQSRDMPFPPTWLIFVVAALLGVLITIGLLASYHRGWSRFQRNIEITHAHLQYVADSTQHARRELARLTSLHRQAVDWLDLLARAVHHPWRIRPQWQEKPDYDVALQSLPFAMNLATVVEDDYVSATRLRRMTTEHLMRRGWRADAFRDLVREVGAALGQDDESFGIGALDDDLPHSSNNARRMLRTTMGDGQVLERVAVPRLRELMTQIQRSALHGSKPRVVAIDDDPLTVHGNPGDPLDADAGGSWDEFLLDSLSGRRDPVTPLSTSWLPQRKVQAGHHEAVTSYLVMPERLERQLVFREEASAVTVPFAGSGTAGIDLVWRIDMAGPLPIDAISLWDAPRPQVAPAIPLDGDTGV